MWGRLVRGGPFFAKSSGKKAGIFPLFPGGRIWYPKIDYFPEGACAVKNHPFRLRDKMLLGYLIGGMLPMLLIVLVLLGGQSRAVLELSENAAVTEMLYVVNSLQSECNILRDVSRRMYFDEALETIAAARYQDYTEQVEDFRAYTAIDDYEDYYSGDIQGITVYLDNPTLMGNSQIARADGEIKNTRWYGQAIRDAGQARWWYLQDAAGDRALTLVRLLRTRAGQPVGVAALRMNLETLRTQFSHHRSGLYLLLGDTVILSNTSCPAEEGEELAAVAALCGGDSGDKAVQARVCGRDARLIVQTVDGLTLVSVEPYRELLASTLLNGLGWTLVLIAVSVGAAVLAICRFSLSFSRRVERFQHEMERAAQGSRDLAASLGGCDELSGLYRQMHRMVENIDALTERVYQGRLEQEQLRSRQHEVEFKMLASQINPHFLYNTLESIRMKAYAAGDRDAADMVKLLARLMRRNIEVRDTPVPLQQELEMTEAYLKLQRYRFGDAVCYSLEADETVRRLTVLPLLIQPLVENAFQHGVRNCLQGSRITIRAAAEGGRLTITVSDNGVGIPPDRLAELRARLGDEGQLSDTHIGLANVRQRIRLYYGAPYGMTLASIPGQGTVVTLSLPVLSDQSKEECIYDG